MYTLMRGFVPRARPASAGEINNLPDFCGKGSSRVVAFINFVCAERGAVARWGERERAEGVERARSARTPRAPRGARSTHDARIFARENNSLNSLSLVCTLSYVYKYMVCPSLSVSRLGLRLVFCARNRKSVLWKIVVRLSNVSTVVLHTTVLPSWLHPSSSPLASERSVGRAQATEPHLHCGWPAAV